MRIALFSNGAPGPQLFRGLREAGFEVVAVSCVRPRKTPIIKQWVNDLLIKARLRPDDCQPERPRAFPFSLYSANAREGAVWLDPEMNENALTEKLAAIKPDVLLVYGFHAKLARSILQVPRLTAINLHPGPLPAYRGPSPMQWIIFRGEKASAITAHTITEKFDDGPIVGSVIIPVGESEDTGALRKHTHQHAIPFAVDLMRKLEAGSLMEKPQDQSVARYLPRFQRNVSPVDWTQSAYTIQRQCLAARPAAGTLAEIAGTRVCLWNVEPVKSDNAAAPGMVTERTNGFPCVQTGDGALLILEFLERKAIKSGSSLTTRLKRSGALI